MNDKFTMLALQATIGKAQFDTGSYYVATSDKMQKFSEIVVQDCIRTLRSNGYEDAAQCLQDIHFGIEDPI